MENDTLPEARAESFLKRLETHRPEFTIITDDLTAVAAFKKVWKNLENYAIHVDPVLPNEKREANLPLERRRFTAIYVKLAEEFARYKKTNNNRIKPGRYYIKPRYRFLDGTIWISFFGHDRQLQETVANMLFGSKWKNTADIIED